MANNARISVQLQLLAGNDMWKKIIARVSTNQKHLVVYVPISPYLARADLALGYFFLDNGFQLSEHEQTAMKLVMRVHGKTSGRMTTPMPPAATPPPRPPIQQLAVQSPPTQHQYKTNGDDDEWTEETVYSIIDPSAFQEAQARSTSMMYVRCCVVVARERSKIQLPSASTAIEPQNLKQKPRSQFRSRRLSSS